MAQNLNFNQFATKLRAAALAFETEVKEIVEINTGDLEMEAIRLSPGGGDLIRTQHGSENQADIARGRSWVPISQAIGYKLSNRGLTGTVFVERSAGELAAWVEFSTGQDAARYLSTVPAEWKATAQKFYINGKGTIIGKPYMLPAFMKYKELFIADLKAAIQNSFKTV
jgi:hypothetical protein